MAGAEITRDANYDARHGEEFSINFLSLELPYFYLSYSDHYIFISRSQFCDCILYSAVICARERVLIAPGDFVCGE